jgi:hypothetical protein
MSYVALRSIKVQRPDRSLEIRSPGDPVPEAKTWRNVELWVRRGYITPADGATLQPVKAAKQPMIPIDPQGNPIEDLAAYKERGMPRTLANDGPAKPTLDSLRALTKVQLIQLGETYGLELNDTALKEELIASVLRMAAKV